MSVLLTHGHRSALGLEQAGEEQVACFSFSLPFTSMSTAGSVCSAPQLAWHLACAMRQYNIGLLQEHPWDILAALTYQPDMVTEGCNHNRQSSKRVMLDLISPFLRVWLYPCYSFFLCSWHYFHLGDQHCLQKAGEMFMLPALSTCSQHLDNV